MHIISSNDFFWSRICNAAVDSGSVCKSDTDYCSLQACIYGVFSMYVNRLINIHTLVY